jgi:hypothetical protein
MCLPRSVQRMGTMLLGSLLTFPVLAAETTSAERVPLLSVGNEKQLFIDRLFFESARDVTLKIHPARKTGEKNVERDRPWESVTLNWFSVLDDGGRYRMWYECYDTDGWFGADDTSFCYAESDNGIDWTKPSLGLFSYQGSKENNILFRMIGPKEGHSRVHGAHVFKDAAASDDARYKAISQGIWPALDPRHRITGMVSADGFSWRRYPEPICNQFADSQYSGFWDERLNKYVIYGRVGGRGRALGRSESNDFSHFDSLKLVLQADDDDPPASDLYNSAAMKYPYAANVYLMFPSLFHHQRQTLDIHLAVSRDGINWTRPQRAPFIPLGKQGDFDGGSLYMGQGLVRKGSELWQYYSGSAMGHDQVEFENRDQPGFARVYSRAVSRLDGFVSVEAPASGGSFTTPALTFSGHVLTLNVQVRPGGSLRVGLLDDQGGPIQGRSTQDCIPITADQTRALVRWNGGKDLSPLAGKPTKMRVEMSNTSLYAFQFTAADD